MYTARACTAKGGFAPCSAALPFHGGGGWCHDLEHRTHRERCRLGGRTSADRHAVRHFAFLTVCFPQVSACSRGECCSSRCARSHDHCAAAAIKSLQTRTSMASFCCRTSRTPTRKSPTYVAPSCPPTSHPCILLASLPGHPRPSLAIGCPRAHARWCRGRWLPCTEPTVLCSMHGCWRALFVCGRPCLVLITSVAGDGHNVLVLDPLPRLPRHAAPPGLSPLGPLIHTRRPGCCGVPRARRSMQGCEKCLPYCICLQVMLDVARITCASSSHGRIHMSIQRQHRSGA